MKRDADGSRAPADTDYWKAHYHRYLHSCLIRAQGYVHEHPPDDVVHHFGSFLTLLQQARHYPDLHPPSADLIAKLTPWSRRWGHQDAWKAELRFAAREFARQNHPQQQAKMLSDLAALLQLTGHTDQAVTTGEQALELARDHRETVVFAQAGVNLVLLFRSIEQPEHARVLREKLLAELSQMSPHVPARDLTVANAHLKLLEFRYLRDQNRMDEAIAKVSHIIAELDGLKEAEPYLLADMYSERAILNWSLDNYAHAEAIRQRITACERENNLWFLAQNVGNLGLVYLGRGKLETATSYLERGLAIATRLKDTSEMRRARGNIGIVRMCLGEYQSGQEGIGAWLDFVEHTGARKAFAADSLNLSHCYAQLGQIDQARELAEKALQIARESGSQVLRGLALRHLADYSPAHERAAEDSAEHLQRALEIAREYRRRLDEADCLLALAGLAQVRRSERVFGSKERRYSQRLGPPPGWKVHRRIVPRTSRRSVFRLED